MRSFCWQQNRGTTLPGGRVSRQRQRMIGWLQPFQFLEILSRQFEKYVRIMKLKLTEHVWIIIPFWISKTPGKIPIFRTFIAKFWIFWIIVYFSGKSSIFGFRHALWHHNYVTSWPIVLILVCLDRGGQYPFIDTKTKCTGGSVAKILREELQQLPF